MPRRKAFDPAEKLDQAVTLFWNRGYAATSIPALEENLGINRFSIYDTYGDKRTLFAAVLARYTDELIEQLVEPLENGTDGFADLARFLKAFRRRFAGSERARGCLLVNTATEIGSRDPEVASHIQSYFDRFEQAIVNCLLRARRLGELDATPAQIRSYARLLLCSAEGILLELRLAGDARDVAPAFRAIESYCHSLRRV
jgi:TetR/AcrR family transcriptional repressor of nem operon